VTRRALEPDGTAGSGSEPMGMPTLGNTTTSCTEGQRCSCDSSVGSTATEQHTAASSPWLQMYATESCPSVSYSGTVTCHTRAPGVQ
jgi:hypothetical protein